jgi:hypothetical protein
MPDPNHPNQEPSMGKFYIKLSRLLLEFAIFLTGVIVLWYHRERPEFYYKDTMALYYTEKVDITHLWNKQVGKDNKVDGNYVPLVPFDSSIHPAEWMEKMHCSKIPLHEMCTCINETTDWMTVRNCLLQKNTPMQMHSFNHVSLLSMIILWFGMTCGINWVAAGLSEESHKKYNRAITITGVVVITLAFAGGVLFGFIGEGPEENTTDSLSFFILFFVWWIVTMLAIVAVHYDRIVSLVHMIRGTNDPKAYMETNVAQMYYDFTSTQQFLFYSNLLVITPAIAVVIHLLHHWHDKDQMINTIFLLLSMVSIDAFSTHLTTHWESHVAETITHAQSVQVGTIKMFAWMVNVITIYLLLTINYPTIVDEALLAYGLFSVFVLYLTLTFVLPDLVREFTHVYTLHALNMRIIGEFIFRFVALFYLWYHLKHHMQENGAPHVLP